MATSFFDDTGSSDLLNLLKRFRGGSSLAPGPTPTPTQGPGLLPGLLDFGVGVFNRRNAEKEAARRLATAQGPLFRQAQSGAGTTLEQLGDFDPNTFAAERFAAQEALLKPVQEKELADLQRQLFSQGMLGISNFNPGIEGFTPDGTAVNPQLAAFFAAQNADRARRSAGALEQGQAQADRLVNRASNLQGVAGRTQATGLTAQGTQPSRASNTAELLRGAVGLLGRDPAIFKDIVNFGSGLFKRGLDFLGF